MNFIPVTNPEQAKIVESLAQTIWTEYYTPVIGREQVEYMLGKFQSAAAIGAQVADGVLYYLMYEHGEYIGYLAVQQKGGELFLSKIYVSAPLRRKGYGRKTIEFIEGLAIERGLKKIFLTVNRNNIAAIKAYENWGFRKEGAVVKDIGSGFVMDDYVMEKPVG